jgi:hypothetical protein
MWPQPPVKRNKWGGHSCSVYCHCAYHGYIIEQHFRFSLLSITTGFIIHLDRDSANVHAPWLCVVWLKRQAEALFHQGSDWLYWHCFLSWSGAKPAQSDDRCNHWLAVLVCLLVCLCYGISAMPKKNTWAAFTDGDSRRQPDRRNAGLFTQFCSASNTTQHNSLGVLLLVPGVASNGIACHPVLPG